MKKVCFIILFGLTTACIFAQTKTIQLSGKIVDKVSKEPLPVSEIMLSVDSGVPFFHSVVYSDDASFTYKDINIDVKGESMIMKVRALGYQNTIIAAPMDYVQGEIDLGEIEMIPNAYKLDAITVSAPTVRADVNKSTYFIGDSYLKDASISIDILRKIPEISINELTQAASIKGKENTLILINGVNTNQSVDIRSISYKDIERIEIIDIPQSSFDINYDGVINIILRSKKTEDFSISAEDTFKADFKSNTGYVSFRLGSSDKLKTRLLYENNYRGMPTSTSQTRTDNETEAFYRTDGKMKRSELTNNIIFDADYYLSSKDFINISTNTSFSNNNRRLYNTQNDYNNIVNNLVYFESKFKSKYTVGNYTAFYKHKFEEQKSQIVVNGNFNFQNSKEDVNSDYSTGENLTTNETGDKISLNLKIDYENTLSKNFRFNIGSQGYYQKFDSEINRVELSNNFKNFRINAYTDLYGNYRQIKYMVGLKVENNSYDFKELDKGTINHFIFLPRIVITKVLDDKNSLSVNYYRKSFYPSAWLLSPYKIQIDKKTSSEGNPYLRSQVYDYLGLSHTYRKDDFYLRTRAYYYQGSKIISEIRTFDNELNIIIKPFNSGKYDKISLQSTASLKLFKFIQFNPQLEIQYQKYNINGIKRNLSGINLSTSVYGTLQKNINIGLSGSYKSKVLTSTGHLDPMYNLDYVFISKKFPSIGLTLFAGYQDLIKSSDKSYVVNNNFSEYTYSKTKTRGIAFRLIYNFSSGSKVSLKDIDRYYDMDKK